MPFHSLNRSLLVRILTEPKNCTVKQFKLLFGLDKVDLTFTDDALRAIASQALEKKTGARGLRAIVVIIFLTFIFTMYNNIIDIQTPVAMRKTSKYKKYSNK